MSHWWAFKIHHDEPPASVKDHDELYWGSFVKEPLHIQASKRIPINTGKQSVEELPKAKLGG